MYFLTFISWIRFFYNKGALLLIIYTSETLNIFSTSKLFNTNKHRINYNLYKLCLILHNKSLNKKNELALESIYFFFDCYSVVVCKALLQHKNIIKFFDIYLRK